MNPILVESFRGKTLESFHRGSVCVVDENDKVIASAGDITQVSFPRSAMKLFQHLPFLLGSLGEHLSLAEIAIMCGSHNGEARHRNLASTILEKVGLNENDLLCGAQLPELKEDKIVLYKSNLQPTALFNNCSGKHAGFLSYCIAKGYETADYINPKHPLQLEILAVCSLFYGYPASKINIAMDGCSAPIFSFPLFNMAVAYKNLVVQKGDLLPYANAAKKVVDACTTHPYLVAGAKRYCTLLMEIAGDRLVAKTGADGIYCIALRKQKIGIAIKIDDGKMGPQYTVAQHLLKQMGVLSEKECTLLNAFYETEIINYSKHTVGFIKGSGFLKQVL